LIIDSLTVGHRSSNIETGARGPPLEDRIVGLSGLAADSCFNSLNFAELRQTDGSATSFRIG
jgi:hypothetical protein